MAEDLGHRRIGKVVGRDIHRLDRGDRRAGNRGNTFLELGDLAGERGLITDARGQTAEQTRHLASRLHEPVDIVDQ
jgi:hypothetical protein